MFLKEPRQEFAQSSRPTLLFQGRGRISASSDVAKELLRPDSRLIGSEDAMHSDGDAPCAAPAAAHPILDNVDLPTRGRHLEAEPLQILVPKIAVLFRRLGRVDGTLRYRRHPLPLC